MTKLLHDTYIHNLIRLEIRKWELRKIIYLEIRKALTSGLKKMINLKWIILKALVKCYETQIKQYVDGNL